MAKRNGYFQLVSESDKVLLKLIPPTDGGANISLTEIVEYMNDIKLEQYDLIDVKQALATLSQPVLVKISNTPIAPVSERSRIRVSADHMTAVIRLYPPSNHGKLFSKNDLLGELTHEKIQYGIQEKVVNILSDTPVYCHDIIIAKGKAVREGHDAEIKYNFETQPLAKPKLNEDGTVDFHQLNMFTKVTENQLLATLIPEDPGEVGIDVYNMPVAPHKVHKKVLKCGRNIRITEDKLQMYSEVSGDVRLEGDTVFVSNTYNVAADVDPSTGDIEYEGNVVVAGNVRTGFKVRAVGDVQVNGVVEGAEIYAGGNIILARGIQGMTRGKLEAKGDIVTKFIESASVKAGGTIRSGSILHSKVEAGDTIICEGRRAYVVGGMIAAKNLIDVKSVGNDMGVTTEVFLGYDESLQGSLLAMQKEMEANMELIQAAAQILMLFKQRIEAGKKPTPEILKQAQEANNEKKKLEDRQIELANGINSIRKTLEENAKGRLKVNNLIYPGVNLRIANSRYTVKDVMKYCQFRLVGGEITAEGL